jgi:hypothetical protein
MSLIYQSALFEALGWTLIDSLWQMGAIWSFYSLFTFNGSRHSSTKRHGLAMLSITAGTIWFFVSLAFNYQNALNNESLYSLSYFFKVGIGNAFDKWRFLNKNIYRKNLLPADNSVWESLTRLSEQTGITKKITIWFSEKVESPLTLGFLKPLIILPVAAFSQLTYKQAEAVIVHELFHIKRNDYLLNLLMTFAEVILFFNPFARILFDIARKERENSCDDKVLAFGFSAWEYSEALYKLGKYQSTHNNLVLAATGNGKEFLLQRVKRMMTRKNTSSSIVKPLGAFFLCLFVAALGSRQPGQMIPVLPVAKTSIDWLSPVETKYVAAMDPVVIIIRGDKKLIVTKNEKRTTVIISKIRVKPRIKQGKDMEVKEEKLPLPPAPPAPDQIEQIETTSFASDPGTLEFTMIDIHKPEVRVPAIVESPLPYVPGSTFYYPDTDSTKLPGRKVIKL